MSKAKKTIKLPNQVLQVRLEGLHLIQANLEECFRDLEAQEASESGKRNQAMVHEKLRDPAACLEECLFGTMKASDANDDKPLNVRLLVNLRDAAACLKAVDLSHTELVQLLLAAKEASKSGKPCQARLEDAELLSDPMACLEAAEVVLASVVELLLGAKARLEDALRIFQPYIEEYGRSSNASLKEYIRSSKSSLKQYIRVVQACLEEYLSEDKGSLKEYIRSAKARLLSTENELPIEGGDIL